jgi:hypothetical protein
MAALMSQSTSLQSCWVGRSQDGLANRKTRRRTCQSLASSPSRGRSATPPPREPPPRCLRLPHAATIALPAHRAGVPALGRRPAHAGRSSCVGFLHGELGWWINGEGEETGEWGGCGRE